jgi:hypothetical protein
VREDLRPGIASVEDVIARAAYHRSRGTWHRSDGGWRSLPGPEESRMSPVLLHQELLTKAPAQAGQGGS